MSYKYSQRIEHLDVNLDFNCVVKNYCILGMPNNNIYMKEIKEGYFTLRPGLCNVYYFRISSAKEFIHKNKCYELEIINLDNIVQPHHSMN